MKKNGVDLLKESINRFKATGGKVKAVVGIGQKNTSIQGLSNLLPLCDEAWIYHNESSTSTFHPKAYFFEKPDDKAAVFVGSNNLTGGGLFSNYEAGTYSEYDLKEPSQAGKFEKVKRMFQTYSTPSDFCKPMTPDLLAEITEDYLHDETREPRGDQEDEGAEAVATIRKKVFGSKRFGRPALPKSDAGKPRATPIPVTPSSGTGATSLSPPTSVNIECDWSAKGRSRWKKQLKDRDIQIVSTVTSPTGNLSLTQAKWMEGGRPIDQTTYFRFDLFGNFVWRQEKTARATEITDVTFCVKIEGKDVGRFQLRLRYNPKWESGQNNYTTGLSWGALTDLIKKPSLSGKYITIYNPPEGQNEPFFLEIG